MSAPDRPAHRRVVVTGIGLCSPIGNDLDAVSQALQLGRGGIQAMPEWPERYKMNTAVAGLVGLLHGEPFLTGNWIFPAGLPLGTPLLFDVGVFLTVLGAVLHMLLGLLEREG